MAVCLRGHRVLIGAAVIALVVGAIAFAIKTAFSRRQVTRQEPVREVGQQAPRVDDELGRLRREMRDFQ